MYLVCMVIEFHVSYCFALHLPLSAVAPNRRSLALIGYTRRHRNCQIRRRSCQGNSKRSLLEVILFHMTLIDPFDAQAALFAAPGVILLGTALRGISQLGYGVGGSERIDTIGSSKERELCLFTAPIARERSS